MLKLLKYMKNRERWMVLGCIALIIGQIYFDLTMPDYMSDLTVLINTPGSEMADIGIFPTLPCVSSVQHLP